MWSKRVLGLIGITLASSSFGACDRFVIAEAEGHIKREIVDRLGRQTGAGKKFYEFYNRYKFEDVSVDNSGPEKKICGYITVWQPPDNYSMRHVRFVFVTSNEAVILNPMEHYDCKKKR